MGAARKQTATLRHFLRLTYLAARVTFLVFFIFFFKVSRFHVSHKDYGLQNSIEEKRAFRERGEKIFIYRSSLVRRYRSGNYHLFMSTVMSDFFS